MSSFAPQKIRLRLHEFDQWKQNFKNKVDERSDLALDPPKKKQRRPPADLRWKFYKIRGYGGGLRAALLDINIYIYIYI